MNERPTKAAKNRPRKLPSVHFQKRLIVRFSCEFPTCPKNRARTIASRRVPLHSAYILGLADDVTESPNTPGGRRIVAAGILPARQSPAGCWRYEEAHRPSLAMSFLRSCW